MPSSLVLEFVRQLMRWLSGYLLAFGVPEQLSGFVQNPEFVAYAASGVMLTLSETGWLVTLYRRFRVWLSQRSLD